MPADAPAAAPDAAVADSTAPTPDTAVAETTEATDSTAPTDSSEAAPSPPPVIDRLHERLAELDEVPVAEHPARYEQLHADLTEALKAIDRTAADPAAR